MLIGNQPLLTPVALRCEAREIDIEVAIVVVDGSEVPLKWVTQISLKLHLFVAFFIYTFPFEHHSNRFTTFEYCTKRIRI